MCDYSLEMIKSRAAEVGDKLVTSKFESHYTGTGGFASIGDAETAICLLPGTEVAFDAPIKAHAQSPYLDDAFVREFSVGRFVQIDTDTRFTHHDALELPDGERVKLNNLVIGQTATVLQLPAQPLVSHVELPADCEASEPAPPVARALHYVEATD